jgi:hypothetical protein
MIPVMNSFSQCIERGRRHLRVHELCINCIQQVFPLVEDATKAFSDVMPLE